MSTSQEQTLAQIFVDLSDTLVADFDIIEFLHLLSEHCAELPGVQAAGIMIGDNPGNLRVLASSSEQARLLELFEVEAHQGPCVDCFVSGRAVADPDLDAPDPRWARFAARAREAGFHAVHAIPMRLRDDVVGVLNLFSARSGGLEPAVMDSARALANTAALGLLQHRAIEYRQVLAEEVQHAMNSRVSIEQAKGIVAEHLGLDMPAAFAELRRFAARSGLRLSDLATAVTAGDHGPPPRSPDDRSRVLLLQLVDVHSLAGLRAATGRAAVRHGLSASQTNQFVLAVHEAAVNTVRHGGGGGQVLVWLAAGALWAEISDHGGGIPDDKRVIVMPDPGSEGGRGLALIDKVCAVVDIQTGVSGTRLLLGYPLDSPALPAPGTGEG
ncbi:ANTAR domain-containing protein [Actinoplanes palleronii]|uniref:ANTAR domain-containing protein n=1 Tax=Actinoplanes palleronii TaxID=113570 RepID=A0ABQ4BFZ6_9ACTN|nr:ANTAR domain-containing protein [Actinoplanes palleronii]GIE69251.1 hypothetical protein Apa02nite_053590 [Actinoplanes palleronii]